MRFSPAAVSLAEALVAEVLEQAWDVGGFPDLDLDAAELIRRDVRRVPGQLRESFPAPSRFTRRRGGRQG